MSKKSLTGGIDFSKLKLGTGTYFRKDDEDDPFNNGGMGGLGNNPIMWRNPMNKELALLKLTDSFYSYILNTY